MKLNTLFETDSHDWFAGDSMWWIQSKTHAMTTKLQDIDAPGVVSSLIGQLYSTENKGSSDIDGTAKRVADVINKLSLVTSIDKDRYPGLLAGGDGNKGFHDDDTFSHSNPKLKIIVNDNGIRVYQISNFFDFEPPTESLRHNISQSTITNLQNELIRAKNILHRTLQMFVNNYKRR